MAVAVTPPERTPEIDEAFNTAVLASIGRLTAVVRGEVPGDSFTDQIATNFVNFAFTGPPPSDDEAD